RDCLECRGRLQGEYRGILIRNATLSPIVFVEEADLQTIHGGVGLTMTKVPKQVTGYTRLRRLVKRVRGERRVSPQPQTIRLPRRGIPDRIYFRYSRTFVELLTGCVRWHEMSVLQDYLSRQPDTLAVQS
ncbi:hypothetical protein QZH41_017448, partial [Actinostola sp. cb2023]